MPHTQARRRPIYRLVESLENRVLLSGGHGTVYHTGHYHTVLRDAALAVATPAANPVTPSDLADYPGAIWVGAGAGNYSTSASDPRWIAIHTTEESAAATITEFTTPGLQVSVNYMVTLTGQVYQFVHDSDVAYDVGNLAYNTDSIGIEDERYGNILPTEAEYVANAKLVDWIAKQYNIPLVHYAAAGAAGTPASVAPADPTQGTGIIGHYQVPDPNNPSLGGGFAHHTDPVDWNWLHYMSLVDGNYGPSTPTNVSPGANIGSASTTPTLTASAFVDTGYQTSQAAAEWQVYHGKTLVYDSGVDTNDLTSITVPAGKLTNGLTYTWQVRYEDNYGDWSSYTTAGKYTVVPTVGKLTATAISSASVSLAWTKAPGVDCVLEIQRSTNGGRYVTVARLSGKATSFTDKTVAAKTTYTYRIRAITTSGVAGTFVTASPITTPRSTKRRR